jgi:hypothetical protein
MLSIVRALAVRRADICAGRLGCAAESPGIGAKESIAAVILIPSGSGSNVSTSCVMFVDVVIFGAVSSPLVESARWIVALLLIT